MTRLPMLARVLLRLTPLSRQRRAEVHADVHELFAARRRERGAIHAHWRLYHDVASLWSPGAPVVAMRDIGGDVKYAARLFAHQPGIVLMTIAGLSLGLAIATAAFSIMNAAVLRGEGVVDSKRAPAVLRTSGSMISTVWRYEEFLHLREGATRMQVEAMLRDGATVRTTPDETETPAAAMAFVSGGFFAATGGRTLVGRAFERGDEQFAGPPPVVLSFNFWVSRLNQDPAVVGRTIRIGRTDAIVLGVIERRFAVPNSSMLWLPLTAYNAVYNSNPERIAPKMSVEVFGRLRPDAGLAEAEAQLSGVAAALPRTAGTNDAIQVRLDPDAGLGRVAASTMMSIAAFVVAVIGLVLLLACANVASVLVAAAIGREREMGVRAALGASRARIVRQLVTESAALGVVAAAVGLLGAYWAIPIVGTMIEAPAGIDLAPDLNVYLFLGIATLLAGIGAGLAPAWHGRGVDLVSPLKADGADTRRTTPRRLRSALVMTQAAVSVLLIVVAALFVRATYRVASLDVGFDPDGLYEVHIGASRDAFGAGDAGITAQWARVIAEVERVPGVASATLVEIPPFAGVMKRAVAGDGSNRQVTYFNRTRAGYFRIMGLRVVAGRIFTREEMAGKAPVAVVSETLARRYWPDRSPLGEPLPADIPLPPLHPRPQIIGVVTDTITAQLHEPSRFAVYQPLDPASEIFGNLMIRTAPGAIGVVQQVAQRLRTIEPRANVRFTSVADGLRQEAGRPRMLATLSGVVGIIAIVLCVIGLYGLTASVIGQRTREMGVRLALGASRGDLLRLLMWQSLRPVIAGLAAGAGAALLASRAVVATMFFGMSPQDPLALAGAIVVLLIAAMLAVVVPTRRAASVDAAAVLHRS